MRICFSALDHLGFGNYKEDAEAVLEETKAVAAKKRRGSSRLENLGIPEEELLRQQQELFAKVGITETQSMYQEWHQILCSSLTEYLYIWFEHIFIAT